MIVTGNWTGPGESYILRTYQT